MEEEPNLGKSEREPERLQREVEKLTAENLLLRLRVDFEHLLHSDREKQARAFKDHKSDVEREISKRLLRTGLLGLVVIGFAWWSTFQPLRQAVRDRLDREFASKNIKALILDAATHAAQSQSKGMIQGTLKPAIDQARKQIQRDSDNMRLFAANLRQESRQSTDKLQAELKEDQAEQRKSMGSLRKEYSNDLGRLQAAVDYEDRLKGIQVLKDDAMEGSVSSYEKLAGYRTGDRGLATDAQVAVMEVKGFYANLTRISGVDIQMSGPNGTKGAEDASIPAPSLVVALYNQPGWRLRAKAAQLLGDKRRLGVAEALLHTMQADPNLWVRRESLRSFSRLTGFRPKDVFDFQGAAGWWKKNKDRYLKTVGN